MPLPHETNHRGHREPTIVWCTCTMILLSLLQKKTLFLVHIVLGCVQELTASFTGLSQRAIERSTPDYSNVEVQESRRENRITVSQVARRRWRNLGPNARFEPVAGD